MKIDKLIDELEAVKSEHDNLEIVKNDSSKILGPEIDPKVRNLDIGKNETVLQL